MRTARNVSFAALLALLVLSSRLDAYPIVGDPTCDDPEEGKVSFVAEEGSCSEEETECAEACYLCYDLFPKDVDIDFCNPGVAFHFITCTCHLAK